MAYHSLVGSSGPVSRHSSRHRLRRSPRIDAARAEEQQLAHAVPMSRVDDVGLDLQVVAQELRPDGCDWLRCRRPWRPPETRTAAAAREELLDRGWPSADRARRACAAAAWRAPAALQPADDGRTDQAAVPGDEDRRIEQAGAHSCAWYTLNPWRAMCASRCASSRSSAAISRTSGLEVDLRLPAELGLRLAGIAEQRFDLGGTEIARIDADDDPAALAVDSPFLDALALPLEPHAQRQRGLLGELAHRVLLAGGNHEILRPAPAAASATVPARSRARAPSRACESRLPRYTHSSSPARTRASPRVILRVTKVSPRIGDSWLNRMPLQAYRP